MKSLRFLENIAIGFITAFIACLIVTVLYIFISFFFSIKKLKGTEVYKRCGISSQCKQCYFDCKRFGMEYSNYNPGGWGASSCWCMKKDNIPVRIW